VVATAVAAAFLVADPKIARRRIGLLRDRISHLRRTAPEALPKAARDLSNRLRGLEARARIDPSQPVDDDLLEARIRTSLGRVPGHVGGVGVRVRDGRVTLTGPVLVDDLPTLLAAVAAVPGVVAVDNQLTVYLDPDGIPALQGPGQRPELGPDILHDSWAPATRLVVGAAGMATLLASVRLHGIRRLLATLGGGAVVVRALANLPLTRLLGLSGERRGIDLEKTLELAVPVDAAYTLWDRYEEFPVFMEHVRDVRRNPDETSHWTIVGPAGIPVEFDARVTRRVENEVLAWESVEGAPVRHEGSVRFESRPASRSRVTVRMSYNPPAGVAAHAVATAFGADPKHALDEDLLRFKSLLETGKTTAHGEERYIGEISADAAAWSPVAAGAGMSPAGVASDALAAILVEEQDLPVEPATPSREQETSPDDLEPPPPILRG